MSNFSDDLKKRTRTFGVRVIKVTQNLGAGQTARVLGDQLLRCGTSVGANYRAACRARSSAEFRAKLGIVEEECDEAIYWLEMIIEVGLLPQTRLTDLIHDLIHEANEILAITVTSINTSRKNSK